EEEEDADAAVPQGLGDPGHLVWDIAARRPARQGSDVPQRLAVTRAPVARAEAPAGDAEVARERRQARDGPGALPAVRALVHRAAPEKNHRGPGRRVAAGERCDPIGRDPGLTRRLLE